jgi:hypothetical protein
MKLVEGVDYTLEEGKLVFTQDFLLRRGYCCNSRCRNCPYKLRQEENSDDKNQM